MSRRLGWRAQRSFHDYKTVLIHTRLHLWCRERAAIATGVTRALENTKSARLHLSVCSFCENAACLSCLAEVATGNLLDLAEGAPMALVHSGKMQNASDPFMAHNHATENNNTVWVRAPPVPRGGFGPRDRARMEEETSSVPKTPPAWSGVSTAAVNQGELTVPTANTLVWVCRRH